MSHFVLHFFLCSVYKAKSLDHAELYLFWSKFGSHCLIEWFD